MQECLAEKLLMFYMFFYMDQIGPYNEKKPAVSIRSLSPSLSLSFTHRGVIYTMLVQMKYLAYYSEGM